MDQSEIWGENVGYIQLASHKIQRHLFVNTMMNLKILIKGDEYSHYLRDCQLLEYSAPRSQIHMNLVVIYRSSFLVRDRNVLLAPRCIQTFSLQLKEYLGSILDAKCESEN
jgi:hypothetical protein